jgi:hypothetical protein
MGRNMLADRLVWGGKKKKKKKKTFMIWEDNV